MVFTVYCLGAVVSSSVWLSSFLKDETTPKSDVLSWAIVAIATLSWPLSVPLAINELRHKKASLAHADQLLDAIAEQQYI